MELDQEEKRKSLMEQANFSRLIIVQLGKGNTYDNIKQIQDEIDPKILALVPEATSNLKFIPYLSTGQNIHQCDFLYETQDGSIFVEDTVEEMQEIKEQKDKILRQVYFASKPNQV